MIAEGRISAGVERSKTSQACEGLGVVCLIAAGLCVAGGALAVAIEAGFLVFAYFLAVAIGGATSGVLLLAVGQHLDQQRAMVSALFALQLHVTEGSGDPQA
jgi:hypothetical protein